MASLDMSLDDMIKSRRSNERGRGRGRPRRGRWPGGSVGGGRMSGPPRRGPLGVNARPSAYTIAKKFKYETIWQYVAHGEAHVGSPVNQRYPLSFRRPNNLPWQRDLFEESLKAAGLPGFENGTKLYVSNLDSGVTNEDIRELFSEMGELIRYAIHYDKNGRPSGSAEVLFARRSDAIQAFKRYNDVQLDGKSLKIEIVGSKPEVPVSARVNVVGGINGRRTVVMTPGVSRGRGSFAFSQRSRGGMRNGRGGSRSGRGGGGGAGGRGGAGRGRGRGGGRGRGRGRKEGVNKSVDQLDKELESYHAENMQS